MPEYQFATLGKCCTTQSEITIAYEVFLPPAHTFPETSQCPVVLLLAGLGMPGTVWSDRCCGYLAAEGYRVVRYDQRDTGRSTHLEREARDSSEMGSKSLLSSSPGQWRLLLQLSSLLRDPEKASELAMYTLEDLSRDALQLLTHLKTTIAHLVGFSLGGMVAQLMALHSPQRVASLTLISSHHNGPDVSRPSALQALKLVRHVPRPFSGWFPPPELNGGVYNKREEAVLQQHAQWVATLSRLSGCHSEMSDAEAFGYFMQVLRRSGPLDYRGARRQFLAALSSPSRSEALKRTLTSLDKDRQKLFDSPAGPPYFVPTVVMHGQSDTLFRPSNAVLLANAIPGSRLTLVPGMGHSLHPEHELLIREILRNTAIRDEITAGRRSSKL